MTPLQKVAMGLVIVLVPAYFPAHPHPAWAVYDAVPDPIGWALVVAGIWALACSSELELSVVMWLAVLALVVSIPMWLPQVNHLLVPKYNPAITVSMQWALSLPQTAFSLVLARTIGRAGHFGEPRDAYLASRFGVLTWAFGLCVLLPAVAYGGDVVGLQRPTLLIIGMSNVALIFYLFMVNRRVLLGGPGPRDWTSRFASEDGSGHTGPGERS